VSTIHAGIMTGSRKTRQHKWGVCVCGRRLLTLVTIHLVFREHTEVLPRYGSQAHEQVEEEGSDVLGEPEVEHALRKVLAHCHLQNTHPQIVDDVTGHRRGHGIKHVREIRVGKKVPHRLESDTIITTHRQAELGVAGIKDVVDTVHCRVKLTLGVIHKVFEFSRTARARLTVSIARDEVRYRGVNGATKRKTKKKERQEEKKGKKRETQRNRKEKK